MSRAGIEVTFEGVFRRLTEVTAIRTSTDLAVALGISNASVSSQKTANTFSPAWAVTLASLYDLDLNFLLFGREHAERQRGMGDIDRLLQGLLEHRYGVDMTPDDPFFKVLRGELTVTVERFLGHIKS
jgi:hypothetical protein